MDEKRNQTAKNKSEDMEVREENRKLRYLRFLVDFSILSIQQDDLLREEAIKIIEDVKRSACSLFSGKEETFEIDLPAQVYEGDTRKIWAMKSKVKRRKVKGTRYKDKSRRLEA